MIKKDLLTGEEFDCKRINQQFACSENRIKYHNQRATDLRHNTAYINKPINKNIKILNELLAETNEATFPKQFLLGKGLNFGVVTHYTTYENRGCHAIYNFIIIALSGEQIKIIKK